MKPIKATKKHCQNCQGGIQELNYLCESAQNTYNDFLGTRHFWTQESGGEGKLRHCFQGDFFSPQLPTSDSLPAPKRPRGAGIGRNTRKR